jgi:CheY-like chemotaxis protein
VCNFDIAGLYEPAVNLQDARLQVPDNLEDGGHPHLASKLDCCRGMGRGHDGKTQGTRHELPLVLLVEDDRDNREMYAAYLTFMGYEAALASGCGEAMTLARRLKPAVVVTDVRLPDADGIELITRLRADEATSAIPTIVLTGDTRESRRRDAEAAGCSAFLLKPCGLDVLVREVARHAKRRTA